MGPTGAMYEVMQAFLITATAAESMILRTKSSFRLNW
jgi:hypothetical protein